MTAIADEADVAVQTLYAVFGNKRAILTELADVSIVGEDHAGSLADSEDWQQMEREPDPRQIALFASIATRIGDRRAAVTEVIAAAAAAADPAIATLYRQQRQDRYRDERRLARSLAHKRALRAGLTETQATDTIWAIVNARTYRALVHERKWTTDQYERWLTDLLARALLADPTS